MKKKVSKKLVAAIVAGLTLAASVPAMAAVNPFTDVPAKHWAYAAVSKLAAEGIVDGYGDGTFRGDRAMTRYEMAQVVAKAMAHEDRANAEQKAAIEKLRNEFQDELNTLGVRMTKLENKVGNITWSGQVREWYSWNDEADATKQTRLLLFMKAPLTDEITFHGRLYAESDWGQSNALSPYTGNTTGADASIDQAYLAGKHGNLSWTLGRQGIMLGKGLIYAWFPNNDGATVTFGGEKTKLTLAAFRNQAIFTTLVDTTRQYYWDECGVWQMVKQESNPRYLNIVAANLSHQASKDLNLTLAYAKSKTENLSRYSWTSGSGAGTEVTGPLWGYGNFSHADLIDTWALGATYTGIKNVTLIAEYGQNRSDVAKYLSDSNSAQGWVAQAKYKGAEWAKPHTGGIWVGYRKAENGFLGRNGDYIWETGAGSADSTAGYMMNDVKGMDIGVDYTIFKNAILTMQYFDLEDDCSPWIDKKSFVAQLRYMF